MGLRLILTFLIFAAPFAGCKKLAEKHRANNNLAAAATKSGYAYWARGDKLYRGYVCHDTKSTPKKVKEEFVRDSECGVVSELPQAQFKANIAANFRSFTNQEMQPQDHATLDVAIAMLQEDRDTSDMQQLPMDAQKLDYLVAKYLPIIEKSMGAASPMITVDGTNQLGLDAASRSLIRYDLEIPFGKVVYSPRFHFSQSKLLETLNVQMSGGECSAFVTGITLFDNTGTSTYTINNGAGIFRVHDNREFNMQDLQISFNQSYFDFGKCRVEVSQLGDDSDFRSDFSTVSSGVLEGGSILNSGDWRLLGTFRFTGGFNLQSQLPFDSSKLRAVRAVKFDSQSCPKAKITNIRTTPPTNCPTTALDGQTNIYVINNCGATGYGGKINGLIFNSSGLQWNFCDIPFYGLN